LQSSGRRVVERAIDYRGSFELSRAQAPERGLQTAIELIIGAASRNGWNRSPSDSESAL
jgi:hypothetical protein